MRDAGAAPKPDGQRPSRPGGIGEVWLRAWLWSALSAVAGSTLVFVGTWLLWRARGWQPGDGGDVAEIGLFLRMLAGGLLGAFLGGLLAARGPEEVCLTAGAGGCLTYVLGLQIVVMLLYAFCPALCTGAGMPGITRLLVLLLAGCVGALAPPLIAAVVVHLRRRAPDEDDQNKTDSRAS